jgi:serine/threonine protein kinase
VCTHRYKAFYFPDHAPSYLVAVKFARVSGDHQAVALLRREAIILAQLSHRHILQLVGAAITERNTFLVLPYCEFGSLRDYLIKASRFQQPVSRETKQHMALDLCDAVRYMHSRKLLHCDLACRNVLISSAFHCMLSDFGAATFEHEVNSSALPRHVAVRWTAPELLRGGSVSYAMDVWSFGVLLWELYSNGAVPYESVPDAKLHEHLVEHKGVLSLSVEEDASLNEVLQSCFHFDPQARPSMAQLLLLLQHRLPSGQTPIEQPEPAEQPGTQRWPRTVGGGNGVRHRDRARSSPTAPATWYRGVDPDPRLSSAAVPSESNTFGSAGTGGGDKRVGSTEPRYYRYSGSPFNTEASPLRPSSPIETSTISSSHV